MKNHIRLLIALIFLLTIVNSYAVNCPSVPSWGSDVTFDNLPGYTSTIDPLPPTAVVLGPTVGENPNDLCKFTAGGDTSDLHNGSIDVYAFREPYTLAKICTLNVSDWKSGSGTINHYCVFAHGHCNITGNNDGYMHLQLKGFESQFINTQAGNCSGQ